MRIRSTNVAIRPGGPGHRWYGLGLAVAVVMAIVLIGAGLVRGILRPWPSPSDRPAPRPARLTVASTPPGATVSIDGQARGTTPLVLSLAPGIVSVGLRRAGMLDETIAVHLEADQPALLTMSLWSARPWIRPLRAPGIGRAIVAASLPRDGRVALMVAPLAHPDQQELWLVEPDEVPQRIGPPQPVPVLALAGDGAQVAYLTVSAGATARPAPAGWGRERLDEVWLTRQPGDPGARLLANADVPALTGHWLTDLVWAPDERHLLVAAETQRPGGPIQTQLLWLPIPAGTTQVLASLDGQIVPGSWRWAPTGDRLAFLAEEAVTRSTVLAVLTPAATTSAARLRNIADAADSRGSWLPTSPLTWTPDGRALLFPLPATTWGAAPALGLTDLTNRAPVALPGVAGQAPVWRDDAMLLTLQPMRDGGLALRRTTRGSAAALAPSATPLATSPSAVMLPRPPSPTPPATSHALGITVGGSAIGAVWDIAHRQALVVAPQRSARQDLVWWWVRWAGQDGSGV